jgi:parallel beta-helix repeat protein
MSGLPGNSYAFATDRNRIGDATAAIWHQRHEEQHAMKTQTKRTVSRAVGVGLVASGLALGVAACAGSPAQHKSDNTHSEEGVSVNTQTSDNTTSDNTVSGNTVSGNTAGNTVSGNTAGNTVAGNTAGNTVAGKTTGNTVVGLPDMPSISIPDLNVPGSTVVGLPGVPSIGLPGGNGPGNTFVWFPGGSVVTGSSFVS